MIERPTRRGFLTGLGAALITAPAIVRAASLMPVKAMPDALTLERMQSIVGAMRGMQNWANDNIIAVLEPSLFDELMKDQEIEMFERATACRIIRQEPIPLS